MNKTNRRTLELRALRAKHDLNQSDMAKILGLSKEGYYRKETGRSKFTEDEINKILRYFKVKYEDIFLN